MRKRLILFCCLIAKAYMKLASPPLHINGTKLALSTSAYQIEGAWNGDGRGPSVWDTSSHESGHIQDKTNGDIACDHYHKWEEDLDMIAWTNASAYRFSISWSRILPHGDSQRQEI